MLWATQFYLGLIVVFGFKRPASICQYLKHHFMPVDGLLGFVFHRDRIGTVWPGIFSKLIGATITQTFAILN
ncbi:hypothetical protein [Sulfobacillus thermosulfidooxidans]|uniref:hypothetical protein n=1 Tax=Sulfobacillus thermosulfidooxidans TaxID=28034 RepID=UPI0006B5AE8B|nr:hypothetical protein [Sulfobacillus thermosulfidooxidans]